MAINDRRGAATMMRRRNFLIGIASLIAAPAIVRAEAMMPIAVWRPTFYKCGGHHGWPYMLAGSEQDLLGFDLSSLGLPAPSRTISVAPKLWVWRYENFPIEKLPRSRVHIPLWQQRELDLTGRQNAALAAVSTSRPCLGGGEVRLGPQLA